MQKHVLVGIAFLLAAAASALSMDGSAVVPRPIRKGIEVEDLGVPVKSRSATRSGLIKEAGNGHWHLIFALEAYTGMHGDPPFQIYDLDLDSGKARIVDGVVGRPGPRSPYRHSSGKVYFGQSRPACLLEYDLTTGKTRECGTVKGSYYFAIGAMTEGSDGRLYVGGWGRHAAMFDPQTGEFVDYGPMGSDKGYGYTYSITADDKYVYCGMGVFGKWYLVVYNKEAKTWEEFFKPDDPRKSTPKHVVRFEDGSVGYAGKYLIRDGKPVEVEAKAFRAKKRWNPNRGRLPISQAKTIGLEIDTDGMQPTGWNNGEVIVRWRALDKKKEPALGKANEAPWRESRTAGADVQPNCVKRLARMADGRFIGMSAFYGNIFTFDPETRESRLLGPAPFSVYDILVDGKMVYFSGYPTCFAAYDTGKPWTFSKRNALRDPNQNPFVLQRGGKSNRQMALGADGRVYIGGHHYRHDSGASLNWFDPRELPPKITHLRKGFEDHGPSDLVALNKGRYIVMGYGPQIVLFDTTTQQVAKRIDLPEEVGEAGVLLAVDPDKVMSLRRIGTRDKDGKTTWSGRLCLVDTSTGKVLHVKELAGKVFSGMTSADLKSADRRFPLSPDGCGWLFIDGDLCRINPADGRVEKVVTNCEVRGMMFFVGDDLYIYNGGRQYFGGFAGISRIRRVFE